MSEELCREDDAKTLWCVTHGRAIHECPLHEEIARLTADLARVTGELAESTKRGDTMEAACREIHGPDARVAMRLAMMAQALESEREKNAAMTKERDSLLSLECPSCGVIQGQKGRIFKNLTAALSAERARAKGMEAVINNFMAESENTAECDNPKCGRNYVCPPCQTLVNIYNKFAAIIAPSPAKEPPIGTCSCHSGSVCGEACHRGCHHDGCGREPKPLPAVETPCVLGEPIPHGPHLYRSCATHKTFMFDCEKKREGGNISDGPAVAPVESLTEDEGKMS